jgi:hypothetical protein
MVTTHKSTMMDPSVIAAKRVTGTDVYSQRGDHIGEIDDGFEIVEEHLKTECDFLIQGGHQSTAEPAVIAPVAAAAARPGIFII